MKPYELKQSLLDRMEIETKGMTDLEKAKLVIKKLNDNQNK